MPNGASRLGCRLMQAPKYRSSAHASQRLRVGLPVSRVWQQLTVTPTMRGSARHPNSCCTRRALAIGFSAASIFNLHCQYRQYSTRARTRLSCFHPQSSIPSSSIRGEGGSLAFPYPLTCHMRHRSHFPTPESCATLNTQGKPQIVKA